MRSMSVGDKGVPIIFMGDATRSISVGDEGKTNIGSFEPSIRSYSTLMRCACPLTVASCHKFIGMSVVVLLLTDIPVVWCHR